MNNVLLKGTIVETPRRIYVDKNGNNIYRSVLSCKRLSDFEDKIVIHFIKDSFNTYEIGDRIQVAGKFESYNKFDKVANKSVLLLYVYCHQMYKVTDDGNDINAIELVGALCKPVINRLTPKGRSVADLFLAVNTVNHQTDYIPAISWGYDADKVKDYKIGDSVHVKGRIQSREYQKLINNELVTKVAYEVSINYINKENPDDR